MELFERNKKYTIKRKKEKKKKEMKKTFSPKLEQYTKKTRRTGRNFSFLQTARYHLPQLQSAFQRRDFNVP